MSAREELDPVEAVKSDIEETRADLVDTVNELSDALNPKKRIAAVSHDVSHDVADRAKHAADIASERAKHAADIAAGRAKHVPSGRERQIVGGAVLVVGLVIGLTLWRRRR